MMLATLFTLISLSGPALAQDEFAKNKALVIEGIDSQITALQEFKACAEAATTREEMRTCRSKMSENRRNKAKAHKGMRAQKIGNRIKTLEAKKLELENKEPEEKQ